MMSGGLTKMKSVRCDAQERTDECVVHGTDVYLSANLRFEDVVLEP
jgi:hypothetical protein